MVASDGNTYERGEIERWLRNTHHVSADGSGSAAAMCTSPTTNQPMDARLVPNQAIAGQIAAYCTAHGLPLPYSAAAAAAVGSKAAAHEPEAAEVAAVRTQTLSVASLHARRNQG